MAGSALPSLPDFMKIKTKRWFVALGLVLFAVTVIGGGGIFLPGDQKDETQEELLRLSIREPSGSIEGKGETDESGLVPPRRLDEVGTPEAEVVWEEAALHMGRTVAVSGTVVDTQNTGKACFLNFDQDWEGKFHLVIFASAFGDFPEPPETYFSGRRIRAIGEIAEFQGRPQMVIEMPAQIQFIED